MTTPSVREAELRIDASDAHPGFVPTKEEPGMNSLRADRSNHSSGLHQPVKAVRLSCIAAMFTKGPCSLHLMLNNRGGVASKRTGSSVEG